MGFLSKALEALLGTHTEVDESRRRVIKGAAGLAALAVIGPLPFDTKAFDTEISRFDRMIQTGIIRHETFYVDRTLVIDIPNVMIEHCKFIALPELGDNPMLELSTGGAIITGCYFEGNGQGTAVSLKNSDATEDWSASLQSAFHIAENTTGKLHLPSGTYRTQKTAEGVWFKKRG